MDLAAEYTLGAITFNGDDVPGTADVYYLTDIKGLDMAPLRTPKDNAPLTDGGLVYPYLFGPRIITFEGEFVVQSVTIPSQIQQQRNVMSRALQVALEATLPDSLTALAWTEAGVGSFSIQVKVEGELETSGVEQKMFTFQLIAPDPSLGT